MYHHYTFTTNQLGETEWAMPLLAQTLADWGFESFQEAPDKGLLHAYISDDAWQESEEVAAQLTTDAGALTLYDICLLYTSDAADEL